MCVLSSISIMVKNVRLPECFILFTSDKDVTVFTRGLLAGAPQSIITIRVNWGRQLAVGF